MIRMLAESRVLSRELDIFLKGGSQKLRVMSSDPSFRGTRRRAGECDARQEMCEDAAVPSEESTGSTSYRTSWTGPKRLRECRVPGSWEPELLVVSRK